MGEYQYYEWQTVDRPLTEAEQDAVNELSSHIEVSISRAALTYSWGKFKHDPRQVLVRFFDAHLYMANWGSGRLMFRFPSGILNSEAIVPYCVPDQIAFKTVDGYDVLDMDLSEEEGGSWIESDGALSGLLSLRASLIQGDYRVLYLAWLKVMSVEGGSLQCNDEPPQAKPSVPAGLKQLSPALKRFVQQVDIWECLVDAAAECSPDLVDPAETDFQPLVAQLSREECDEFLCRFALGDPVVGMQLKKRLLSMLPRCSTTAEVHCPFDELWQRAEAIEKAHKKHREQEAHRNHVDEMKALAAQEGEIWKQVASLVETKQATSYEEAIRLLGQLAQLSEFQGEKEGFRQRVKDFSEAYTRLSGFRRRLQQAKLID